jgi:putative nucleotidyltransferase-like protein
MARMSTSAGIDGVMRAAAAEAGDPVGPLAEPDVRRLASVLAGAWRRSPPPLDISPGVLQRITPGLVRSKTGALAWWRVRNSPLQTSASVAKLRDAYHHHGFQAALHAGSLSRVVTRLRAGGVEPLLMKGPAIARHYAERGLRPFADLDLSVRPDQFSMALAILHDWTGECTPVDLHRGFHPLYARSWEELYAWAELVTLGGIAVRVLGPEDHLRLLCLHQLKHGVPSPLWLCDVAVALESRAPTFDWDRVLGPERRRADWIACVIGLAHQLLEVPIDDTPVAARARRLPRWLVPSVLGQWARHCAADHQFPDHTAPAWRFLARAPETFRQYWPSTIAASIHLHAPFNGLPRLPVQVVDACGRAIRFCVRRLLGRRPEGDLV